MSTVDDYRRLAAEGLTVKQAAERLGVTVQGVRSQAKRHGITFKAEAQVTVDRLMDCAAKGMTSTEAADHIGINRTTASKLGTRYAIPFRITPLSSRFHAGKTREQIRAEAAQRERERERARSAALWARKQAEAKARIEAEAATLPAPVRILLDHLAKHGRLSERAVRQIPEHILGAAMARLSGRAALQEARG